MTVSRLRRLGATVLTFAMVVTAVLVPAAPASAHQRLARGLYACYEGVEGGGFEDKGYSLKIMRDRRYAYIYKGNRVGTAGRFRHPSGDKIVFRSGYLYNEGYDAVHHPGAGVELQLPIGDGWYKANYCTTMR